MSKIEPAFGVELKEPFYSDKHWVSPFNWLPEVRDQIHSPERVFIHDVTLRDGEQTARIAFTPEEKIYLAQKLDHLGVHSIEPGLPVTPEDLEVIKTLSAMDLKANIVPLVRVKESDVVATIDAKADGMLLEFGINPYLLKHVYKTTPEKLIEEITTYAKAGKEAGMYVEFMGWDVFRIPDQGFIRDFFAGVAEAQVDRVTVADTFGMGHPLATYHFIRKLREWTGKPVGFHIHNDYGMAAADSLMAVSAGADMVHSSINGLGERAGNVATEEISFILQHLLHIDASIDLTQLKAVSSIVTEMSKAPPARNKPIVGDGLFEVESGIVVHLVEALKDGPLASALFPFQPEDAGHAPYSVVLGRGTGLHSVKRLLSERNLEASDEQMKDINERIKQAGLMLKNGLPDALVEQIVAEVLG
ncbi:LeuA family protein [Porticoccus sp. GXU_MW_L64]